MLVTTSVYNTDGTLQSVTDPKALVAELQILAAELEELTRSVELVSPAQLDPGAYRTSVSN